VCVDPSPEASGPARLKAPKAMAGGGWATHGGCYHTTRRSALGLVILWLIQWREKSDPASTINRVLTSANERRYQYHARPSRYSCYDSTDSRY